MRLMDKIKYGRLLKKARKVSALNKGCKVHMFGEPDYRDGDILICLMESGKQGLFKAKVWNPSDPGDQYFYDYEFLCYV